MLLYTPKRIKCAGVIAVANQSALRMGLSWMIWLGSVSFHESLKVERESEDQAEIFPVDRTGPTVAGFEDEGPSVRKGRQFPEGGKGKEVNSRGV